MLAKVTWKVGRVYRGDQEIYSFDLLPEDGHKFPAFINLQQYYVEQYLIERCADFPDLIDLRFKNKVVDVAQQDGLVTVRIETPDGVYQLRGQYLLACDGASSQVHRQFGLEFDGRHFEERLIADVEMEADFPSERWFWFTPNFIRDNRLCCINNRTISIVLTCSLAPMPMSKRKRSRKMSFHALRKLLVAGFSRSTGSAFTVSIAAALSGLSMNG